MGCVQTINLCTAAAPVCPAGRTNAVTTARLYSTAHRRRLLIVPPSCRRLAGVYLAGMWQRGTRERGTNGRGPAATTAMWPAVLTGGRPSPEAAGQLPAGSALALCRSISGGNMIRSSGRPPAGGGQTKGSGWMRSSHGQLPERRPGERAKGRDRGEERARRSRPGATLAAPGRSETYFPV